MKNVLFLFLIGFVATSQGEESTHTSIKKGARPVADLCSPSNDELISFQDFSGERQTLKSKDPSKLTLAIVAGSADQAKVERFVQELGTQLALHDRTRQGIKILSNAARDISELFRAQPNIPDRAGARTFFSPTEMEFAVFADTRSEYKPQMETGWQQYYQAYNSAVSNGRSAGSAEGARRVDDDFWASTGNFFTLGWVESYARGVGEEEGARTGAQVAETIGPPILVQTAQKEILNRVEPLQAYIRDFMRESSGGATPEISFAVLVDKNDFADNVFTRSVENIRWANSYAAESGQSLDAETARATHNDFTKRSNDATEVLSRLLNGRTEGFTLAFVSPQGKVLKVIDPVTTSSARIASIYYDLKRQCLK